jgi:hypothetical protein
MMLSESYEPATSGQPKKFSWFVVTTLVVCIDSKATEVATTNTKNQFGQALVFRFLAEC